ncbi:MAG: hypothetical protein S4CHLAM2_01680 [Chlamydiales bacterium]|nr:hypothetical protein [Chlamydiales bacterium]
MKKSFALILLLLFSPIFADTYAAAPHREIETICAFDTYDEVLLVSQKVLAAAHEVARWKWNYDYHIENEENLRTSLLAQAELLGIEPGWAAYYIDCQMKAMTHLQMQDFEKWKEVDQPLFDHVANFTTELVPYLYSLMSKQLELASRIYLYLTHCYAPEELSTYPLSKRPCDAISAEAWALAVKPFVEFAGTWEYQIPPQQAIERLEQLMQLDHILLLVQKRLSLFHEVARWKWKHGCPIVDEAQERWMREFAVKKAIQEGISCSWALEFVHAQMKAAARLQECDFDYWEANGFDGQTSELKPELQPYLMELTEMIFEKIGAINPNFKHLRITKPLPQRVFDILPRGVWRQATKPFKKHTIQPKENA